MSRRIVAAAAALVVVVGVVACISLMGARRDDGASLTELRTIRIIVHRDGSVNTAAVAAPAPAMKSVPKSDPDVVDGLRGYDDPDWTPGASPDYTTQSDFMKAIPNVEYEPPKRPAVVVGSSSAKLNKEVADLKSQVSHLDRIIAGRIRAPAAPAAPTAAAPATKPPGSDLHGLMGQLRGLMTAIRNKLTPQAAKAEPVDALKPAASASSTTELDRVDPLAKKIEENSNDIASMKDQLTDIEKELADRHKPAKAVQPSESSPSSSSSSSSSSLSSKQYTSALAMIEGLKKEVAQQLDKH